MISLYIYIRNEAARRYSTLAAEYGTYLLDKGNLSVALIFPNL